jgi:molybdate transport system ATP-binding protein
MATLNIDLDIPRRSFDVRVELNVGPETVALAGPSGAGKTSVLRAIAGLERPRGGKVVFDAEPWLDTARGINLPPEQRRVGYLPQEYALFPHLSVWRNVAYSLRHESRQSQRRRALAELDRFGLAQRADVRPGTLSGGERQRVALARALASSPRVLLLDEPLAALDTQSRGSATRELSAVLSETGAPAILVTHDFHEAALLSQRVAIIDGGRLVQQGDAAALAVAPASAFVADFIGAVVLTGHAHDDRGGLTVVELDGGGAVTSTDSGVGPVAVSVFPWEITLVPASDESHDSARNRVVATVQSITAIGNRVRVGLLAGQPMVAEITQPAADELHLRVGGSIAATWKATATRVTGR